MTPQLLNDLVALFSVVGYNLCSAKYAFRKEGMRGFARFIKNEEKERWELQDLLIKNLADLGIPTTMGAIPAPIQNWSTPLASLTTLVSHDDLILTAIEGIQADETNPAELEYLLMKLAKRVRNERNEIYGVARELSMTVDVYAVDQSLYERYKHKAVSKY